MTGLVEDAAETIAAMMQRGGPRPDEYDGLTELFNRIHAGVRSGELDSDKLGSLMDAFGESMSLGTVQGFGYRRPHGYAGDFEVIDRIYNQWVSPYPHLARWDHYFHSLPAPKAVRNRIPYLHRLLTEVVSRKPRARILDLGSGSGRSMFEWFKTHPETTVHFDCVEVDPNAIAFATELNREFLDRVTFQKRNVFWFQPESQYDLIWSSGLFDYFEDAVFVSVGQQLFPALEPGGEMVVGNFAPDNPQRAYMETIGGWILKHREPDELVRLMILCGSAPEHVRVGAEPEGVNLFAHARRGS